MPRRVSVPEKTLEHWSSQYITYRYNTQASLWWPASREDIGVGSIPPCPGKSVQLELKTTTVSGRERHDVIVDLGQLWNYLQRPAGLQPFYAFPWPDWHGNLAAVARAHGRDVTDLGFKRSEEWWFAEWMYVLTAAQVGAVLQRELAAHKAAGRKPARLVRFGSINNSTGRCEAAWGSDGKAADPKPVAWLDFWSLLDGCGRPGWPQLIRVPARLARSYRVPFRRDEVTGMLRQSADLPVDEQGIVKPLTTLEPGEDGGFQISEILAGDLGQIGGNEVSEAGDNRQVVFIDARGLFRERRRR